MPSLDDVSSLATSWQANMLANATISVAFFTLSVLIFRPVLRLRQVGVNWLAPTAAAMFFCAAAGRGLRAFDVGLRHADTSWHSTRLMQLSGWQGTWDALTACLAVAYLMILALHRRGPTDGPVLGDLAHRHQEDLALALHVETSARADAEAERDSTARMLRSIIENSQSAIYVKDLDGRYLMANPLLAEIMGLPEEEFLGKTDATVDPDLALVWRDNDILAESGSYRLEEWNDAFPDGRRFYDSVKFPLYDAAGTLYATAGVSLDVTERKRAIDELAHARDEALAAAAAKSTFLATMSHEIRTPMNAVIGMTDLLTETDLDEEQKEFLDTVRTSGDALLAVINDILDFSKIESGEMELDSAPFDLRDEIEGSLDMVVSAAAAKGLELVCSLDRSCAHGVVGDVVRLRQIIINLLSNSVKFTESGEVVLEVGCEPAPDGGLTVQIRVSDSGIGMSEETVARLFKSFSQGDASTTRLYGGTGLGLAICQRLAEGMQGRVEVTSEVGVGSTFTATIVLQRGDDSTDTPLSEGLARLAGKSVLIVDDNPTNLRILDLQLTGLGMVCSQTDDPFAATELVKEGLRYDLAILDMHMPRMDGVELAATLRKIPGTDAAPLVLLTSLGWRPVDVKKSFTAFLTKPVKRAALEAVLVEVLSEGTGDHHVVLAHPTPPAAALGPLAVRPLKILLAEDNPVNQRVAKAILTKLGQEIDIVSDGEAAVDAVARETYDIVLMDVEMPVCDGLRATRRIRASEPSASPYIVAMTAAAQQTDREACTAAGMDAYLSKPVRAKQLQKLLIEFDARSSGAESAVTDTELTGAQSDARRDSVTGSGPPAEILPAIDHRVFQDLMDELGEANDPFRRELIDAYLADGEDSVSQLVTAVASGDSLTVARGAHSLRSTSALLGANVLADLLQSMETAALTDPASMRELLPEIRSEHQRTEVSLLLLAADSGTAVSPA